MTKQDSDPVHRSNSPGAASGAAAANAHVASQTDANRSLAPAVTDGALDASALSAATSVAAAAPTSGAEELVPGLGLDFNVDSLNLDSIGGLAGLDFDVANLLRQVSGAAAASLSADTLHRSLPDQWGKIRLHDPALLAHLAKHNLKRDPHGHLQLLTQHQPAHAKCDLLARLCRAGRWVQLPLLRALPVQAAHVRFSQASGRVQWPAEAPPQPDPECDPWFAHGHPCDQQPREPRLWSDLLRGSDQRCVQESGRKLGHRGRQGHQLRLLVPQHPEIKYQHRLLAPASVPLSASSMHEPATAEPKPDTTEPTIAVAESVPDSAMPPALPSSTAETNESTEPESEEQFLTESVIVTCPAQIAPPRGFDALYGVEGTFRSLCHGVAPTNAEWSSLNIVAVAWPQLEAAATGPRRLAQRDISDVSSMTVADSVRSIEEQRPPSAAIHLYRLHAEPPPAWGTDAKRMAIQPSLLPLCDLRMRQQWDEQVSRANMDRLSDTFTVAAPDRARSDIADWPSSAIRVSPLSGWHGGTSQAGMGERMRVASAPRCVWSADCRLLATSDRAGRFEIFRVGAELNSWHSVYHIDFDYPVVACLWLASTRKYGISRATGDAALTQFASLSTHQVSNTAAGDTADATGWDVDPSIHVRRLPFFGPRNTQGEHALVVVTADGQLVLVYQRDERWSRVVAPLQPSRVPGSSGSTSDTAEADAVSSGSDSPWRNIPQGNITHADMMLVSKKWIYLAAHRAGAAPVEYPHEPGAIPDALKHNGGIVAPTVEVYRIQVEFESDYNPRLFAAPLVVQPITLPQELAMPDKSESGVTHVKLITALNPEVRPVAENVLGEKHHFPLLFVSRGSLGAATDSKPASATTFMQVWRLEGAPHAQRPVLDLLRRPRPLRLTHAWSEKRQGLLLAVIANRAERQQLRYLFAKPGDKDYRALMLTWADGCVEMLRNYQDGADADRFDACVAPVRAATEWVVGSVLSPHYTAYLQLAVRPRAVELGATACAWNQGHARFRLGWAPGAMGAHVQAYCGDLLAVRVLNKEDPTDLVAVLANMAAHEENQPMPVRDAGDAVLAIPTSRTLAQALFRACTRLAGALRVDGLDLDPLSAATPYVRRLLGAAMQTHALAQHGIQAASLGLLLHIASVVEARVAMVHRHILQSVGHGAFDAAQFSEEWRRTFPSTAALVLWCVDLLAALARDTYLYLNVRAADRNGRMRPLSELDAAGEAAAAREAACLQAFRGEGTALGSTSLLPGRIPSRLALLFHRPTLDALRNMTTFVAQLEMDLLRRIQVLNSLPPNAAAIPEYAAMAQARDMVVSTAQQLAHALEHLPVSLPRLKDFLAEVHDLYAGDSECTSLSAQTLLVASSTIAGPFRKYLPQVARSFARFVLEPDVATPAGGRPALPNALVLHDTRWLGVVACRAGLPGLPDGTTVFETPWRVRMPVVVTDPRLRDADEDSLVPAAELAKWEREKSEFERALDEDNVLFDIDDPGFIFFDTS
ncbi:hypothetical protein IWW54_001649, partial [Coemansia sp. RSA 2705]